MFSIVDRVYAGSLYIKTPDFEKFMTIIVLLTLTLPAPRR